MSLGRDEINHRFGFHAGTSVTIPKYEVVRAGFKDFAEFLDRVLPDGRAKSTAMTKLQESSMWSNFGIAELAPLVETNVSPNSNPVARVTSP